MVKLEKNPDLPVGEVYEVSQIDKGFLVNYPGLQIINTVSTLNKDRSLPLLVVNNTNKFIKIYRHSLLTKNSPIQNKISSVSTMKQTVDNKMNLNDLDVPDQFR